MAVVNDTVVEVCCSVVIMDGVENDDDKLVKIFHLCIVTSCKTASTA